MQENQQVPKETQPPKSTWITVTDRSPLLAFDATTAPTDEFRALSSLAVYMLIFGVVEFAPIFLSGVLTGHLSATLSSEFLAARSLATIFELVTVTTFIMSMGAAMDTLCSQAYGAGQLREFGLFFQTGLLVLATGLLPVILTCTYCAELLELAGQERQTAEIAQKLVLFALPGVPFGAVNTLLTKILQGQNRVLLLIVAGLTACVVQAVLLYALMFHSSLGVAGSTAAYSVTLACLSLALITYTIHSGLYQREWPGWQLREALRRMPEFLRLGVSGMVTFMCEVWGFAIMTLSAGWLPYAEEAVSAGAVYDSLRWIGGLCFAAIGLAGSVRVGNALGANDPARARHAARLAMALCVTCALVASLAMLLPYRALPFIFTSDQRVVVLTSRLLLVTSPLQVFTAASAVAQGIFSGCGLQALSARVNFVCYLVIPVPLGLMLAFPMDMGLVGLWAGLSIGFMTNGAFCMYWLTQRADWEALAFQAQRRTAMSDSFSGQILNEGCSLSTSTPPVTMA